MVKALFIWFCLFANIAYGQVSVERLPNLSASLCPNVMMLGPIYRFRITYSTTNYEGIEVKASGLVALRHRKETSTLKPLIYFHPTPKNREDVPSLGSFESRHTTCHLVDIDRILIAPDYPGLGTGDGHHPYMVKEAILESTLDMIDAVFQRFEQTPLATTLDLVGYSQGGHGALAFNQYIEENYTRYTINRTFAMSAPIDLNGVQLNQMLNEAPSKYTSAFSAMILVSYQKVYGDLFEESPFRESYSEAESMAENTDRQSLQMYLPKDPRDAMVPEFAAGIENNFQHPLRQHLAENSIDPWPARARIFLGYSLADQTVPKVHAFNFFRSLERHGAEVSLIQTSRQHSHTTNFLPSIRAVKHLLDK